MKVKRKNAEKNRKRYLAFHLELASKCLEGMRGIASFWVFKVERRVGSAVGLAQSVSVDQKASLQCSPHLADLEALITCHFLTVEP